MPVVLLHGPRQSGRTSLARSVAEPAGYGFLTFDADNLQAAARSDPVGFVAVLPPRMVMDEIQRIPEIFTSIKTVVDQHRMPRRFPLTGSSSVLLLPRLADCLAGRIEPQRLNPQAQCEIERRPSGFVNQLFDAGFKLSKHDRLGMDMARIGGLHALPRLLEFAAAQTTHLFNASDLAGPLQISRPTIRDYITLLERVFLLELLPPWHLRQPGRLVKTPKIHPTDTGLTSALLRVEAAALHKDRALLNQLMETLVFQKLRQQASWEADPIAFSHSRDRDDHAVDIVLERSIHALAGVEAKASGTIRESDFRGLRKLQQIAGDRLNCGVVPHDRKTTARFADDLFAVPIRSLWETKVMEPGR